MKLFQLLEKISKEEFKQLRKAVLSPLFTTNEKVVRLFEILRPQYPNFDDSEKGRKRIFEKIFKTKNYNDYKLRRLFSELTRVVENLFIHLELAQTSRTRKQRLLKVYEKRGLLSLFRKETEDLLKEMEESPYQNVNYHWEKIQLLKTKYFHQNHDKFDKKDHTLAELTIHLDTYFALLKVQLAILLKNHSSILNKQYDYSFLAAIKEEGTTGKLKDNSLLQFYLESLKLVEPEEGVDFLAFEPLFFEAFPALDEDDQNIFYGNAVNYITREFNKANPFFNLELKKKWDFFGLNSGLFTRSGKISKANFGNILITLCLLGDFDMVDKFMAEYKNKLDVTDLDNHMIYYGGIYHFTKGEYDKVLELYVNFTPPKIHWLQVKGVTIRALFIQFLKDDSYLDTLQDFINSFEVYLNRNTYFPAHKLSAFKNFIEIIRLLLQKIVAKEPSIAIKKWFTKQLEGKVFYAKNWLIEKVEEL